MAAECDSEPVFRVVDPIQPLSDEAIAVLATLLMEVVDNLAKDSVQIENVAPTTANQE